MPSHLENVAVKRVMVGTDRSETAQQAVQWAAGFAERYGAELFVVQVVVPQNPASTEFGAAERTRAATASDDSPPMCGNSQGSAVMPWSSSIPIRRWQSFGPPSKRRLTSLWSATSAWRGGRSSCSATYPTASATMRVAPLSSSTHSCPVSAGRTRYGAPSPTPNLRPSSPGWRPGVPKSRP